MFRFKAVFNVLGLLIGICGLAMLTAIPFSIYYGEGDLWAILGSGLSSIALGAGIWFLTKSERRQELKKRDGYLVVTLGWIAMSFIGAVPYVWSGAIPSFTDAFFGKPYLASRPRVRRSLDRKLSSCPRGFIFGEP